MSTAVITHLGIYDEMTDYPTGYREKVFADLWQECNRLDNGILPTILGSSGLGKMTQRDATVAATLVQWLGTNVGSRFLCQAKAAKQAFLELWVKENASVLTGCQHGLLAMLLVPAEKLSGLMYPGRDPISERDIEIANAVMAWLGSDDGQIFLAQAQRRLINIVS